MACEPGISQSTQKSTMEKVLDDQLKASKFAAPVDTSQRRGCYYTEIPRVIKQRGVHGQELTYLNLDKVIRTCINFFSIKVISLCCNICLWKLFPNLLTIILTFVDFTTRKVTGKRFWRFRGPTSWGATVCIRCICG